MAINTVTDTQRIVVLSQGILSRHKVASRSHLVCAPGETMGGGASWRVAAYARVVRPSELTEKALNQPSDKM